MPRLGPIKFFLCVGVLAGGMYIAYAWLWIPYYSEAMLACREQNPTLNILMRLNATTICFWSGTFLFASFAGCFWNSRLPNEYMSDANASKKTDDSIAYS